MVERVHQYLNAQVSAAPLISFRLIFGLLMLFSTVRFMALGWIEDHYIEPVFHFKYWGFSWVEPLSREALYAVHFLMILAAIGIMLLRGLAYRIAAIVLFLTFTYTELIDLTYYLNHYYFVSLMCLLLVFMPSHISPFADPLQQQVKRSAIFIIKAQIAILYVYAGLAKINYDWLIEALPLKIWLPANDKLPLIGPLFNWELTPYLFAWFGMLYDTFIVFFLRYKPSRPWAYLTVIVFHSLTGLMFQIGVFPLVMIGIATIFFDDKWHAGWVGRLFGRPPAEAATSSRHFFERAAARPASGLPPARAGRLLNYLLLAYLGFQLLFPWRYLLYPGNLFWTEEGYRFSWRVMLMEKAGTATFYVKDTRSGREGVVDNREFLNAHQEKQMAMQPDMILQYAHFLGKYYAAQGVYQPALRAEVYVTLNARPSRLLIDPQRDLMKEKDTFKPKDWILPWEE
jgi:hypothetical protein